MACKNCGRKTSWHSCDTCTFKTLTGKTIKEINGLVPGSDRVIFKLEDGSTWIMEHFQDCCESVEVNDVAGRAGDVVGSTILAAYESANVDDNRPYEWAESWTWTFYRIVTRSGSLVISWLGESNGYYSESVDFYCEKGPTYG